MPQADEPPTIAVRLTTENDMRAVDNVTKSSETIEGRHARQRIWRYLKRIGLIAILLSLILGHLILLLQIVAFVQTGEWTNYGLRDLNDYLGLATPARISSSHLLNELWFVFLLDGSLALAFILYIPLLLLILGFVIYLFIDDAEAGGAETAADAAEVDPRA